jgi:hypothetical protein
MKKSKGSSFKKWRHHVEMLADELFLSNFLNCVDLESLYNNDVAAKSIFNHTFALIEDTVSNKILVIYPLSKRTKYLKLTNYSGYIERPATQKEIDSKPHCIPTKNTRTKKDYTTPLFGNLPDVRKGCK